MGHPEHEVSGFQGSWFCEEFNNHIMRTNNKSRKQCTRKTFILHLRRISPVRCDTTRGCWHLREYRIISEALRERHDNNTYGETVGYRVGETVGYRVGETVG